MLVNPYETVDISEISILPMGESRGMHIFKIATSEHESFTACVLRQHLVDFLFDHMRDPWYLGNDDTYIQFSEDDLTLALSSKDAQRFVAYGWLV